MSGCGLRGALHFRAPLPMVCRFLPAGCHALMQSPGPAQLCALSRWGPLSLNPF